MCLEALYDIKNLKMIQSKDSVDVVTTSYVLLLPEYRDSYVLRESSTLM